jgi:hypothetical protein
MAAARKRGRPRREPTLAEFLEVLRVRARIKKPRSLLGKARAVANRGGRPTKISPTLRATVMAGFDWLTASGMNGVQAMREIAERLQIPFRRVKFIIFDKRFLDNC